jgi:hypothetical protein
VEFKTGPKNSDFRHALSQLVDYGSHIWRLSYEEFEAAIPLRYFAGERCNDTRLKHARTLEDAARKLWSNFGDEDMALFKAEIATELKSGAFHYALVAQRLTTGIERTAEYLNVISKGARFYGVELVRFLGGGLEAFEARTIHRPDASTAPASLTSEEELMRKFPDDPFRESMEKIMHACRGMNYQFNWGTSGVSLRLPSPDQSYPITVAWMFPPRWFWMDVAPQSLFGL